MKTSPRGPVTSPQRTNGKTSPRQISSRTSSKTSPRGPITGRSPPRGPVKTSPRGPTRQKLEDQYPLPEDQQVKQEKPLPEDQQVKHFPRDQRKLSSEDQQVKQEKPLPEDQQVKQVKLPHLDQQRTPQRGPTSPGKTGKTSPRGPASKTSPRGPTGKTGSEPLQEDQW